MYSVAYIMKRKPGMSLDDYLAYYRDKHGPTMVELTKEKGLVSYEHFPIDTSVTEGRYMDEEGPGYDSISVYTFLTKEHAEECWAMPEVIEDSEVFIDFDTLITMPVNRRTVFPIFK